jgi:hypothetical protein
LEVLRRGSIDTPGSRNTAIFLLTDGEPNIIPPRGHVQMLQRYYNQHKGTVDFVEILIFSFAMILREKIALWLSLASLV